MLANTKCFIFYGLFNDAVKKLRLCSACVYNLFMPKGLTHVLRRNCLLKHVIEGKTEARIEVAGRRGRRRKQLLDDLKEARGCWEVKEEALGRTLWRTRSGRDCGPVEIQTVERMNECIIQRCGRRPHNISWRAAGLRPVMQCAE